MPETTEYTRLGDGQNPSLFVRWQYLTPLEKGLIALTTIFGVVIFSLAIALAICDAKDVPVVPTTTIAPNSTTIAPNSTTIAPNSTTIAPNSTTIAPNSTTTEPTTTVKPSSTTVKPSSTTEKPSSTTVKPSSTTVKPSSTTSEKPTTTKEKPKPNETENTLAENVNQVQTELTTSLEGVSENTTELLKNIPPIPVTGIKLMSPKKDEIKNKNLPEKEDHLTTEPSAEKYTEISENNTENSKPSTNPVLSRKKRIDASFVAEGKKDNPIYE